MIALPVKLDNSPPSKVLTDPVKIKRIINSLLWLIEI